MEAINNPSAPSSQPPSFYCGDICFFHPPNSTCSKTHPPEPETLPTNAASRKARRLERQARIRTRRSTQCEALEAVEQQRKSIDRKVSNINLVLQDMLHDLEGKNKEQLDMDDQLLDHYYLMIERELDTAKEALTKLRIALQEQLGQPEDTDLPALALLFEERKRKRYLDVPVVSRKRRRSNGG